MVQPINTVAVIGAGTSGVSAAAHLKAAGLKVTLFERTTTAGGVWVFDPRIPPEPAYPSLVPSVAETAYYKDSKNELKSENTNGEVEKSEDLAILHAPPGPCYQLLRNNVPTGLMKTTLNSWPPGTEPIVRHNVLAEYIQDTAAKTGVNEIAQCNTKVEHVSKEKDHWKVETATLDSKTLEKTSRDWEFDAVIVASGHYHAPKVPDIPGLKNWKDTFPLRVQHSKRYRSARGFEGKTVLLIGGSTLSSDIAKDGVFDHPATWLPKEATRIGEIASFNLKQLGPTSEEEAIPGTIILINGEVLSNIDSVIIATGYHCTYPFLTKYHRDWLQASEADEAALVTADGLQMHNLHKDIFYILDPTLAFIGVPYHIATFSLFDFQAIVVAAVYSGKALLPDENDLRAEYDNKVAEKGYGRTFHSLRGKDVDYVNELLAWINPGIVAAGGQPVEGHSKEWKAQYDQLREKFKELLDPRSKQGAEEQVSEAQSKVAGPIEVH